MLLDDKGRLWGKVNIIDFTVILLVILIIAGVAYKFTLGSLIGGSSNDTYTVYLKVRVPNRNPEDVKLLKVGDRLITGTQEVDSWIKKVELAPYYIETEDMYGKPHKEIHPFKKDIIVTIRSEVPLDQKLPYLSVGNQPATGGITDYGIKTRTMLLRGNIIDIREEKK